MNTKWLNRDEYPFNSNYVEINGVNMHYIDEGSGPVILFIHGTPSWSFDFRKIIKNLSANYRCIAIDHVGFGLSDKPREYDHSSKNHAANLENLLNHLNILKYTMVVHDFGGPIGLSLAIKNPDKVQKLIILNSWLWNTESEPEYKSLRKFIKTSIASFLYIYLNFSARFLLPGSFGKNKLRKEIRRQYVGPFRNSSERYGPLGFAKALIKDQEWFGKLWSEVNNIKHKPTLFIWGMADKFVGPKYLERFENTFVNSKSIRLDDVGHFPQEEAPAQVLSSIVKFLEVKNRNLKLPV